MTERLFSVISPTLSIVVGPPVLPSFTSNVCCHCNKKASSTSLSKCSKCLSVRYCGRDCQAAAWSDHKNHCERLAKEALDGLLRPPFRSIDRALQWLYINNHARLPGFTMLSMTPNESSTVDRIIQLSTTLLPLHDSHIDALHLMALCLRMHGYRSSNTSDYPPYFEKCIKEIRKRVKEYSINHEDFIGGAFSAMHIAVCCIGELYVKLGKQAQAYLWGMEFGDLLESKMVSYPINQLEIILGRLYWMEIPQSSVTIPAEEILPLVERGLAIMDGMDHRTATRLDHKAWKWGILYYHLARYYIKKNHVVPAIKAYEKCLNLFPVDEVQPEMGLFLPADCRLGALFGLGSVLEKQGQYAEAKRYALRALADPSSSTSSRKHCFHCMLATFYAKQKRWDEVWKHIVAGRKAAKDGGWSEKQTHILFEAEADAYEARGQLEKAIQWDDKYQSLYGGSLSSATRRKVLWMIKEGQTEEAESSLSQWLAINGMREHPSAEGYAFNLESEGSIQVKELYAELLEAKNDATSADLACRYRQDVAETKAIIEALRQGWFEETREEARAAHQERRESMKRESMKGKKKKKKKRRGGRKKRSDEGGGGGGTVEDQLAADLDEVEIEEQKKEEEQQEQALQEAEAQVDECAICLLDLDEDDEDDDDDDHTTTLSCHHSFHKSCMEFWRAKCLAKALPFTCPYCRAEI